MKFRILQWLSLLFLAWSSSSHRVFPSHNYLDTFNPHLVEHIFGRYILAELIHFNSDDCSNIDTHPIDPRLKPKLNQFLKDDKVDNNSHSDLGDGRILPFWQIHANFVYF